MRVFVQMWMEIDPTLNLRIDRQTGQPAVDEGDVLTRVSPLARYGLAEALRLNGAEVTAFAVGEGHDEALRHAMAGGATKALRVAPPPDSVGSAEDALTTWLGAEKPDLVIADRSAGFLAARLGWAHLAGVDRLQSEEGKLTAQRVYGRGAYEKVTAKLPAVIRLQTDSPQPPYIARARLNRAAILPVEATGPVVAGLEAGAAKVEAGPLQLARPRTRLATAAAAPAKAVDRLNALMGLGARPAPAAEKASNPASKTPSDLAQEFVRYLAHHNLMPGSK